MFATRAAAATASTSRRASTAGGSPPGRRSSRRAGARTPTRCAAIDALLHRLDSDLGAAIAPGGDVTDVLRPFLVLRILGVTPLAHLSGPDALLCWAKLAEVLDSRRTAAELVWSAPAAP